MVLSDQEAPQNPKFTITSEKLHEHLKIPSRATNFAEEVGLMFVLTDGSHSFRRALHLAESARNTLLVQWEKARVAKTFLQQEGVPNGLRFVCAEVFLSIVYHLNERFSFSCFGSWPASSKFSIIREVLLIGYTVGSCLGSEL